MAQNDQSLWDKLKSFYKVTLETWKVFVQLVTLALTLGLTASIFGILLQITPFIIGGFAITIIAGTVILVLIYIANKVSTKYSVRVLNKYVTYRYYNDFKTYEHTKDYRIISLVDDLDKFIDRYKWSCDKQGQTRITLLSQNQRLVEKKDAEWSI